ncbi:MAG TPA: glycosyl transferase family 2 [Bacteroidales bacterium]|nr:glycosyl transferase family 2 [Bacteroidales bacterium]
MQYLLAHTNIWFLIFGGIFCFSLLIQLIYYIFFSRILFWKKKQNTEKQESVSIVICAKNEAENLEQFLPEILTQEYPDFEVVVVNDCSEDETEMVLTRLAQQYPRLKITFIKKDEKFTHGKKLALSLGIKATKNEWLLLTDADCIPAGKNWLASMVANFTGKKEIILGFGGYFKKPGLLNKLIRFDTAFIALQYLSFATSGMPYMGVGRNLAYKRSLFFRNKGFASHAHIKSGDDDLFVNEVAKKSNTCIEFSPESFTHSQPENSMFNWFYQKKRHLTTGGFYKKKHKFILSLEPLTRLLFYFSFAGLIIFQFYIPVILAAFGFRLIVQYIVMIFFTIRLKEKDLLLFLPLFDFLLPFISIFAMISNSFNKRAKYQWTK